ncbi:MAG TPA: glycosyltransferase [Tepidisphaeraceae bacterium]|jgi:hypothetical protein|nr:glycosyltransferase [Tepidisphaeraceae bacterium]
MIDIVAAISDRQVLAENLMRSPDLLNGRARVHLKEGYACAGAAYNMGLDDISAEIVAFIHQDIYLPAGWCDRLLRTIKLLEQQNPSWGVLGVWGACEKGNFAGRVWCSGGNREHIGTAGITPVQSIDEIVIVTNSKCRLRFDEKLPGFHLYGTDIIQQAKQSGYETFVIDAPVVHNSRYNRRPVDRAYIKAYRYMQRKWSNELPIRTSVIPLTRSGWPLYKHLLRRELRLIRQRTIARQRHPHPTELAKQLGYEAIDPIYSDTELL